MAAPSLFVRIDRDILPADSDEGLESRRLTRRDVSASYFNNGLRFSRRSLFA
jgi:hypothetical protein